MKKILFPTEFSKHAPEIFKYAAEVAYFFKADLVMMHAFGKQKSSSVTTMEEIAATATDEMVNLVAQNLPEEYREAIKIDYITKIGFPTDAILQVALEEEVDLIVMGMTGMTNAVNTLLGTTTLDILNQADAPVLMVPAVATFEGIDNMVYTTNFEFRDLGAINYLRKWSKRFEADLHCLHVVEADENELTVMKNMSILKETYKRKSRILFDMARGKFEKKIDLFSKSKKADIIAMVSHKRNLISRLIDRSAVKDLAYQSRVPLLIIKDNAFEVNDKPKIWVEIFKSIA